jgi:competence protein ComEA
LHPVNAYGFLPWGTRPTRLEPGSAPASPIDLNRAGRAELLQLPGVGPHLAERIEAYRRDNGGFRSVEELGRVPGVGPATLARLRTWVSVEAGAEGEEAQDPPAPSKRASPSKKAAASKKTAELSGPVDVNRASAEELRRLPGVGPKTAQAILEERARGAFKSVDDLRRVRGIGPKTLDRLRPHVTVGRAAERLVAADAAGADE